ncbi:hypothetical protein ACL2XP_02420 [Sodalis sp. RH21]|uniref:hypothetical protein n=1 Tax=unclassified Sodalis (in: enterobacteria) TaxID=2636512 RepID=UPI0039B5A814
MIDSSSRQPVKDAQVNFTTTVRYTYLNPAMGMTNAQGQARAQLTYPTSNAIGLSGEGVIPVTASITGASAGILINFYSIDFRRIYITNAPSNNLGITKIDANSIKAGIQAVVYYPVDINIGNIINFHWENFTLQKIYTGVDTAWVINVQEVFIPAQVLSNGRYKVWYTIQDNVSNIMGSFPLSVEVTGSPYTQPVLLRPALPDNPYGIINQAAALAGTRVVIPGGQAQLALNDICYINLVTSTFNGAYVRSIALGSIPVTTLGVNLEITVPYAALQGYDGAYGDFYYEAVKQNAQRYLSFSTRAIIDTVPPGRN